MPGQAIISWLGTPGQWRGEYARFAPAHSAAVPGGPRVSRSWWTLEDTDLKSRRSRRMAAEWAENLTPKSASCSKDSILDKVRIMPKVTSKLQLTVPKKIADQYGIRPGDELEWIPAGESIRVELVRRKAKAGHELTAEERAGAVRRGHGARGSDSSRRTEEESRQASASRSWLDTRRSLQR